ncbi:hypothetical protein [Nocardia sp. NPDC052112]|uniref:hypothetical protein n=1 Tax=Nocardia sp. NPDC052112 TaxID=3155646 RepID=UPI00341261AD
MPDHLRFHDNAPVLIVGGYGTVGAEFARLAAAPWPLLLTGRNPARGRSLAAELDAQRAPWDLGSDTDFHAAARAVVRTIDDRVLRAAVRAGIPYIDITRWTIRLTRAAVVAATLRPTAPVLLSSSWMGGVTGPVTAASAEQAIDRSRTRLRDVTDPECAVTYLLSEHDDGSAARPFVEIWAIAAAEPTIRPVVTEFYSEYVRQVTEFIRARRPRCAENTARACAETFVALMEGAASMRSGVAAQRSEATDQVVREIAIALLDTV